MKDYYIVDILEKLSYTIEEQENDKNILERRIQERLDKCLLEYEKYIDTQLLMLRNRKCLRVVKKI